MTVEEAIAKLKTLPPKHELVTDLHSEYTADVEIELITGVENGGYVSRRYPDSKAHRAHGYVRIGVAL